MLIRMSMEEGKAGGVRLGYLISSSVLAHFAVDVGVPGGTELVGVWFDDRGTLPDIHILFLYSSSDKPTRCCEDHKVLILDHCLLCNAPKHRHMDTRSKYNQNLFSIDKHFLKIKISKFAL